MGNGDGSISRSKQIIDKMSMDIELMEESMSFNSDQEDISLRLRNLKTSCEDLKRELNITTEEYNGNNH